tara:strand:- start:517 stop:1170 length:654 start_codon:yes stop_codon:yes gene_type:complete
VLICLLHEQPGVPDLTAYLDAYRERTLDKYQFIRKIKEVVGVDLLRKALIAARPAATVAAATAEVTAAWAAALGPLPQAAAAADAAAATEAKVEAMKKQMQEMKRQMQVQKQGLRDQFAAGGPVDEAVKRKRDEHWAQLREVTKAARKEVGEVESIEASREPVDGSTEKEYLVKWKGFDEKYNTWRKASELTDTRVQALIDAFEAAPEAAGAAVAEA